MASKTSFYNNSGVTNEQSNAIDASVSNAEASATSASNSATSASNSATAAANSASSASASEVTATTKASESASSATDAETARDAAVVAKNAAEAVDVITDATVSVSTLPTGSSATASVTATNGTGSFSFGIPQGPAGADGSDGADSTVAGPQGVKGDTGDTGPQGIQGIQGVQGTAGADGADADTSNLLPLTGGTLTGGLDVTGTVTSNDVNITDTTPNLKFTDTDGNHLANITQSGSHLYIDNDSTGKIRMRVDGNTERLTVNSTGVDVNGTVTADGLTIANTGIPQFVIQDLDGTSQRTFYKQSNGATSITAQDGTSHGRTLIQSYNGTDIAQRLRADANGDISFYDSAGSSQAFFWDSSTENLGIGTVSPSAALNIVSSGLTTQFRISNTESNETTKYGAIVGSHYTNVEEPIAGMLLTSSSAVTGGSVSIGGGISAANAVNNILFYTAANNITLTGSERMRITSSGNVGIGNSNPTEKLDVTGNIAVSGTVDGRDIATNIPASLGTAGQVLTVNSGATATEWADASGGGGGGITTGKAIAMAMVFG